MTMMRMTLAQFISQCGQAERNCRLARYPHAAHWRSVVRKAVDLIPIRGIESVDADADVIIIRTSQQKFDDVGNYDGWGEFVFTIRTTFSGLRIEVECDEEDEDLADDIADALDAALSEIVEYSDTDLRLVRE